MLPRNKNPLVLVLHSFDILDWVNLLMILDNIFFWLMELPSYYSFYHFSYLIEKHEDIMNAGSFKSSLQFDSDWLITGIKLFCFKALE